jgi:hypothetical protein
MDCTVLLPPVHHVPSSLPSESAVTPARPATSTAPRLTRVTAPTTGQTRNTQTDTEQ